MKNKEAIAEEDLIDEGFVVYKGSKAVKDTLPSCKSMLDLRNKLIDSGTLSLNGCIYIQKITYLTLQAQLDVLYQVDQQMVGLHGRMPIEKH